MPASHNFVIKYHCFWTGCFNRVNWSVSWCYTTLF